MTDHNYFANLIWQIADLLRGPYRLPQYERVMLPMTVLRRFDCVLASSKAKVLAEHARRKGGRVKGEALDRRLNNAAGQRFHNHSPLNFRCCKIEYSYLPHSSVVIRRYPDAPATQEQKSERTGAAPLWKGFLSATIRIPARHSTLHTRCVAFTG